MKSLFFKTPTFFPTFFKQFFVEIQCIFKQDLQVFAVDIGDSVYDDGSVQLLLGAFFEKQGGHQTVEQLNVRVQLQRNDRLEQL